MWLGVKFGISLIKVQISKNLICDTCYVLDILYVYVCVCVCVYIYMCVCVIEGQMVEKQLVISYMLQKGNL